MNTQMRKLISIGLLSFTLASCGSSDETVTEIISQPPAEDPVVTPIESADAVIPLDQIIGGAHISVDEQTGYVSGITTGKSLWVYEPDQTGGALKVEDTYFDAEIDFDGQAYVNIYLEDPSIDNDEEESNEYTAILNLHDKSIIVDANRDGIFDKNPDTSEDHYFSDYHDFLDSEYSQFYIEDFKDNYPSDPANNGLPKPIKGNFILRLGDSNYTSSQEFTIKKWEFDYPEPIINPNLIKNAEELTIEDDGTITGRTANTDKLIIGEEIHETRIYSKVDGNLPFRNYEYDFDIEIESGSDFVNIYLESYDNSDSVRLSLLLGQDYGENVGKYLLVTDVREYLSYDEVLERYGDYRVIQFTDYEKKGDLDPEDSVVRGNFIWRSSDSAEEDETQEFTVYLYEVSENE